jgi:hypothetical protein
MRITERQLRQLIKEELTRSLREQDSSAAQTKIAGDGTKENPILFPALREYIHVKFAHEAPGPRNFVKDGNGKVIFSTKEGKLKFVSWLGDDGIEKNLGQLKANFPSTNPNKPDAMTLQAHFAYGIPYEFDVFTNNPISMLEGMEADKYYYVNADIWYDGQNVTIGTLADI